MKEFYNNYSEIDNFQNWKIGIYTRLSNADKKDENLKQSESIDNQIELLHRFVKFKGWHILKTYIDDGYSGTNFDRPDFKRMINDIESGEINLIITKDLSRLGRDYIETGYYVEKYFPLKNVRYIALNDNIDTFDTNNTNNDMTPFKSVINDTYARDTSKKVRSILMTMALNGKSIKAFQPYGLKKDPDNKNNVLIDEEVSQNVYNIFMMYKSGMSKKEICNYLEEHHVLTPLKYKELKGNYHNPNNNKTYRWNNTVINKILRDRSYVGDLVQHKTTKVNYKIDKHIKVDKSRQIIIENCFPAIIDRNTFNIVQDMLDKQTNEWTFKDAKPHLLRGITFCSCGSRITYVKNHGKTFKCVCSSYKRYGKKFCTNVHMTEEQLINKVLEDLRRIVNNYLSIDKIQIKKEQPYKSINNTSILNKKIEQLDKLLKNLYEDKISNIISDDMFITLSKDYEQEKYNLLQQIKIQKEIEIKEQCNTYDESSIKEIIKSILRFDKDNIDRNILLKLIDKIVINDKEIHITYKFAFPEKSGMQKKSI